VLVLDASVAVTACLSSEAFGPLSGEELVAPPLLWSEAQSVLHELAWRGSISGELASVGFDRLTAAPVSSRHPRRLGREAWEVADMLGMARMYDAEYVALARLLRCRLVTTDARLQRVAAALVEVVGPTQL
jgi:predicted nucleic acid-binding protein